MNFTSDPELLEMFRSELEERTERLIEGARALQRGEMDDELSGAMLREGHTIKGTSRVMGFEAISLAGQAIEQLWRKVQRGEIDPDPALGEALESVAAAICPAVTADPATGTPELVAAVARLTGEPPPVADDAAGEPSTETAPTGEQLADDGPTAVPAAPPRSDPGTEIAAAAESMARPVSTLVEDEPAPAPATDVVPAPIAAASPRSELGGLLGALESWAAEESVPVNAGRLYRLINSVADLRNEIDSLVAALPEGDVAARTVTGVAGKLAALQRDALVLPAVPIAGLINSLPPLVRYLAKRLEKDVRFDFLGDEQLAIDRQVVDVIADAVRQLVVNAVRHGIEVPSERSRVGKSATGTVSLIARVKDGRLELSVTDDGAGIDWEAVRAEAIDRELYPATSGVDVDALRPVLFHRGFTTVTPSDLGGEGKGLHAVAEAVETLYGRVKLETTAGVGTTVTVVVPTSRALQRIMVVEDGDLAWGLPEVVIEEVVPVSQVRIDHTGAFPVLEWHDRRLPVVPLGDVTGAGRRGDGSEVVVVSHRLGDAAITVSRVIGSREVAVKELGPLLAGPAHITGAALLGGGDVVLVLDAAAVFAQAHLDEPAREGPRVLVVDDSRGARAVVAGALASSGFRTSVASSVADALELIDAEGVDAVVVDFSMPREDGVVLVDAVRTRHGDLPVVMLSAVATPEDQDRALRSGVDAFFEKADFREGALAETLRRILAERGGAS